MVQASSATEIVLSQKNLRALTFAMEVLQSFCKQKVSFKDAIVYKQDKKLDRYEIGVRMENPFHNTVFIVGFTMEDPFHSFPAEPHGTVEIGRTKDIHDKHKVEKITFRCNQGTFEVPWESDELIEELANAESPFKNL